MIGLGARWAVAGGLLVCVAAAAAGAAESERCGELSSEAAAASDMDSRQISLALFKAADLDCAALVERLLGQGASVHARDRLGRTALIHAARAGASASARVLLDRGAPVDQPQLNGSTPLFVAAEADKADIAELLLAADADINILGRSGLSPLAAAAFNADDRMALLLLDRGADATVADRTGKTPILYAAARGRAVLVGRMLDQGIDPNQRYAHELTALMWAAGHPDEVAEADAVAVAGLLLEHGARVDDADDRGRTALMIAAEQGHPQMVEMLLGAGAAPERRDLDGKSAFDLAADTTRESLPTPR